MGSDDGAPTCGFFFSAAGAPVPRAAGQSSAFSKSKVSKRRELNRLDLGKDKWESPGVNPFASRDWGLGRGNVSGAEIGSGGGFRRGGGLGDYNLDMDFGRLKIEGGKVGGDGCNVFGMNLEKELPKELSKLNINGSNKAEGGLDAGKLGRSAMGDGNSGGIATSELPNLLRKLNIGEAKNLANQSENISSSSGSFVNRFIFESSRGNDDDPNDVGMDSTFFSDIQNKLKTFGEVRVSSLDKVPLESNLQERVKGEGIIKSRIPPTETVVDAVDAAPNRAAATADSSSSSSDQQPEANGTSSFISKQSHVATPFSEFRTPNSSDVSFVSSIGEPIKFGATRDTAGFSKVKKKKGKSKQSTIHAHSRFVPDIGSNDDTFLGKQEASEPYSPMDISPYEERLAVNGCSTETSGTSTDANVLDKDHISDVPVSSCLVDNPIDNLDEILISATQHMHVGGGDDNGEANEDVSSYNFDRNVDDKGLVEESMSGAETESFKSATEEIDFIPDDASSSSCRIQASSSSYTDVEVDQWKGVHDAHLLMEATARSSFTFSASSSPQGQSTVMKRKNKKKPGINSGSSSLKLSSSSEESFATARSYLSSEGQSLTSSSLQSINQSIYSAESGRLVGSSPTKGKGTELGSDSVSSTILAAQEACEKWRLRGNQAYASGDALKAEECYTHGMDSVPKDVASRSCSRALMLCYSNRAATRHSLGRMRDAIQDCMMAIALDPNFFKVQVRAANCFLSLGEIDDALQYYKKCLQPGNDVCVDRKITIEASEGLQKVKKVSELISQTELLMRSASKDVKGVLEIIDEALAISPFSERLLQTKAEALFMLQKYEEVIQLCEDTLDSAVKSCTLGNVDSLDSSRLNFKMWRCNLIFKSHFKLGRLEQGLASIERVGISNLGAVFPLVNTACELLRLKTAGNEAFQAGRYTEAIENYAAALSCDVQSCPFAAICFCNRAAAYKASGQILDAIADCSLAMALDENYLKAISRRATLFEMIRDYGQAAADLQRLVSALTKQEEKNTGLGGASNDSLSCVAELKKTCLRLAEIEEEARKDIPLDMYLILGVEPLASISEIKKAYRKAALRHHPDKATQFLSRNDNGNDKMWKTIADEVHKDADRLFKMIGEAYAILSDPVKRLHYDTEEETRKAPKKHAAASTSRMYRDEFNPRFERSARQPHTEAWRYYSSSTGRQARGPETYDWTRHR
ncbi:hypothetical protein MLD38_025358 [Melastoma candidum]|uniref:Uncharacterized protein n=1 Tax=Melastoma candidum TaxID=119954 RepID=A0ACB9NY04_9MYRT|nr:hypothetical protein MLD38_025358 [Melastoma candidum]